MFGPYGHARYYACCINTLKGFTGQYNDGSGLDYFNARYYDPVAGMFMSADTVQGNMQAMNPYAYVNGNPETQSDPSGRMFITEGGSGGGGATIPCGNYPQPAPAPIASGGGYLPNDPGWHQVGSLIAFGYQYGEQIVTASVMEAFQRQQFNWLQDGIGVTLDRVIAYQLALTAQAWRNEFQAGPGKIGGFPASNNVGDGLYYVTDPQGNLVQGGLGVQDPVRGRDEGATFPGQFHSERTLFTDFYTNILPDLNRSGKLQSGYTLHYIIFSQFKPCQGAPSSCTASFPAWGNALKSHVGPGVNIDFSVWTTKGNAYRTLTSVTQVKPYYSYYYTGYNNSTAQFWGP